MRIIEVRIIEEALYINIYMYVWRYVRTTFSGMGTPLCKGGRVRPQPFFRSAAYGKRAELSI